MAKRMFVDTLMRLTLTQKGKATAKHPLLREGVVEVVKAMEDAERGEQEGAEGAADQAEEGSESEADGVHGWYALFEQAVAGDTSDWDCPEAFVEGVQEVAEKATKKNNYPSSRGPFAGPHNSFPIASQQDVYDAARLIGHAQNPAAVKSAIIRIAHSKGFSLPKSWQTGPSKKVASVSKEELAARLMAVLDEAGAGDEPVEKAAPTGRTTHEHDHHHMSGIGYAYSHAHPHGHDAGDMHNHDMSETAHAHQHVAKANGEPDPMQLDELEANQRGLKTDLQTVTETVTALKASIDALVETVEAEKAARAEAEAKVTEATEKAVAAEAKATQHEETLKAMEHVARRPMTAPAPQGDGKPAITKDMSFEDAFKTLMRG